MAMCGRTSERFTRWISSSRGWPWQGRWRPSGGSRALASGHVTRFDLAGQHGVSVMFPVAHDIDPAARVGLSRVGIPTVFRRSADTSVRRDLLHFRSGRASIVAPFL